NHLRRRVERQDLLDQASVRARPGDGTSAAGKQCAAEYFRFPLHNGQAVVAYGDAAVNRTAAPAADWLCEPSGRGRLVDLRWREHSSDARGKNCCAGEGV